MGVGGLKMRLGRFVVLMLALAVVTGGVVMATGSGLGRAIVWAVGVLIVCQVGYFITLTIKAARLPHSKDDPPSDP